MFILSDDGKRGMKFNNLHVKIEENMIFWREPLHLKLTVTIRHLYKNHRRYTVLIPKECISKNEMLKKLIEEYEGLLFEVDTIKITSDKKYEALEWLDSFMLIDKLANC